MSGRAHRPNVGDMSMTSLPVIAGIASTVIFVGSTMPMLTKAVRTRDLSSYSPGNLVLASTGNLVHALYVFSLPPSPLWALHSFNLLSTAAMLTWYVRYEVLGRPRTRPRTRARASAGPAPGRTGWVTTSGRPMLEAGAPR